MVRTRAGELKAAFSGGFFIVAGSKGFCDRFKARHRSLKPVNRHGRRFNKNPGLEARNRMLRAGRRTRAGEQETQPVRGVDEKTWHAPAQVMSGTFIRLAGFIQPSAPRELKAVRKGGLFLYIIKS